MTLADFQGIDLAAYAKGQPLDAFMLRTTRGNLAAFRDRRPICGVWSPGAFKEGDGTLLLPEVSSYRTRALLPFLYHLAPSTTEVTVRTRLLCPSTVTASPYSAEMVISARAMSLDQFSAGTFGADDTDWTSQNVTGGAVSPVNHQIALDVSGLGPGWIVILLGLRSGEAVAATEVVDSGGSGTNCYTLHRVGYFALDTVAGHTLGTGVGNQITHQAAKIQVTATGKESGEVAELQEGHQVIHITDSGSGAEAYKLYVYPPIESAGVGDQPNDAVWLLDLGYAQIHNVTVFDSGWGGVGSAGARSDGERPASYLSLVPEVKSQTSEWLTRTRVHAIGPQPIISEHDWTGEGPVSRVEPSLEITNSYQTLAQAYVGGDDEFDWDGATYSKTAIEVAACLLFTHPSNRGSDINNFKIDWRLRCTDLDGSTDATDTDFEDDIIHTRASPLGMSGALPGPGGMYNKAAWLAGWTLSGSLPSARERHALRGFWPEDALRAAQVVWLRRWQIVDGHGDFDRLLSLQVKGSWSTSYARTLESTRAQHPPRVTLVTWTVLSQPFLYGQPDGDAIGVL